MLKKYTAFVGLCLGFFIIIMDMTTVPLIYTTLMDEFNVSLAKVAWVNNSYLITYAGCLLLGGRLGDFTNRKFVVLAAYLALGAGAAISGAGQTFTDVILGRALMGVGAGLLTPQSMAYISILFGGGGRGTALGIWGAVAGIASATGPVMTQIFLTTADWRWVMWINIPIAAACFILAAWSLPNAPGRGMKVWDTLVSVLCGACLVVMIIGIQCVGAAASFLSMGGGLFATGMTVAIILIRHEIKTECSYILPRELWFNGVFLKICLISGLLGFGLTGFYLPIAFLLDVRMSFGPIAISIVMVTIALSNAVIGPLAGHISDRMEPQKIVRLGLILFALANVLLGFIGLFMSSGALAFIALCGVMMVAGAGTGLAFAPLANLALSQAQAATMGRAAAFFSCTRQVFSALGGVMTAIVFDGIMRLQFERRLDITATSLRESSNATAIACVACFLFIALSLGLAAYLSRKESEKTYGLAEL